MNRFIEFFRRRPNPLDLDKEISKVLAKHNKDYEESQRFIIELLVFISGDIKESDAFLTDLTLKKVPVRQALIPEDRLNKVIHLLKKIPVLPSDLLHPIRSEIKALKRSFVALDNTRPAGEDLPIDLGFNRSFLTSSCPRPESAAYQQLQEVMRQEAIGLLKRYQLLLRNIRELLLPLAD